MVLSAYKTHSLTVLISMCCMAWFACAGDTASNTKPEMALPLSERLQGDYSLSAYLNQQNATLHLETTDLQKEMLELEISFSDMETRRVPSGSLSVTLAPGQSKQIVIPIAAWPDGEYLTTLRQIKPGSTEKHRILRVLRKQTILYPPAPAEPIEMAGLTLRFVDDWYLHEQHGLEIKVHPAEQFPISDAPLPGDLRVQRGVEIKINDDNNLQARFWGEPRGGGERRYFNAFSNDGQNWRITAEVPTNPSAPTEYYEDTYLMAIYHKGQDKEKSFRYYDPAGDGQIPLDQVRVRYTGFDGAVTWGDLEMPRRCLFPVWEQPSGEYLIINETPLVEDFVRFDEDNLGRWQDGNDNFGGQWLSADGKTLFFSYGRLIPRFKPFQIPYDNVPQAYRVMVVWRTHDGMDWTPTYMTLPTENDPVGYQHYGATVYPHENGNLYIANLHAYNARTQQIYIELIYSRDGILWHRLDDQPAFADNGPFNSWNFGWIDTANAVEYNGMVYRLMHYCNNRVHFYGELKAGRELSTVDGELARQRFEGRRLHTWPYWDRLGSWDALGNDARLRTQTIGVMRYRPDGRTSISSTKECGQFVTKVLDAAGQHLAVNAKTTERGRITVEVANAAGQLLDAYSSSNAAVFTGDELNHPLVWGDGLATLPDEPFRLVIQIEDADLFAMHW